jgi:hypothetical protein
MEERAAPVTVFLAYAQKDEELRDRPDEHLGSLKQLGPRVLGLKFPSRKIFFA